MKIFSPKSVDLSPQKPKLFRNGMAVFVRKHSESLNVKAVESAFEVILNNSTPKWLFLIEGLRSYACPENLTIEEKILEYSINALDPIEKPYSVTMAKLIGVKPVEAGLSVLISDPGSIGGLELEGLSNSELEKWFDETTKSIAQLFDITQESLFLEYQKLMASNNDKWLSFDERIKELHSITEQLIRRSNSLSAVKLERVLSANNHKNIFAFSGIAHEGVFI